MTAELLMLLLSTLLMVCFPFVYGPGHIHALGIERMAGNRDNMPVIEGWFTRCKRAHANMAENLLPFAIVVLMAHQLGVHSWLTRAGAEIFLAARIVHAVSYTAGIVATRAPAYILGVAGIIMIGLAIAFAA